MLNSMNLVGRLTKEVEIKHTQSGKAVASFTLASKRNYSNEQGNYEADFIDCVIWGKAAELFKKRTKKGVLVGVTGPLRKRSYETTDQRKIYGTEIAVENFQVMEFLQKEEKNPVIDTPIDKERQQPNREEDPLGSYFSCPIDINNEDLPFR